MCLSFLLQIYAEPQMAEAKLCKKYSGTWSGWCSSSSGCDKKCKAYERAKSGSCEWDSRGRACFCYFEC